VHNTHLSDIVLVAGIVATTLVTILFDKARRPSKSSDRDRLAHPLFSACFLNNRLPRRRHLLRLRHGKSVGRLGVAMKCPHCSKSENQQQLKELEPGKLPLRPLWLPLRVIAGLGRADRPTR
jgi:hypothetical protein